MTKIILPEKILSKADYDKIEEFKCLIKSKHVNILFQDEGIDLGSKGTVNIVDFVGNGVTATRSGNKVTVTIPGGGGVGSINWGDIGGTLSNQIDLVAALNLRVPTSRILTINGVSFDLSADRTWTIPSSAVWGAITGTLSAQTDLQNELNLKVPTSRTITINGVTQDLSANRTWNVTVNWGSIGGTLSNQTDLQTALDLKVPTSRTITINGQTFDLSANRSWTISATNIYNTSDSLTGNRAVTLAGSRLDFVGSSITTRIFSSGRVGINTATDLGKALDVFGDVSITTSDTDQNTIGFNVENSAGTIMIRGFNNGFVSIPQLETPVVSAVSSLLTLRSFFQGAANEIAVRSIFASPIFSTSSTYVNFKTDQTFFIGSGTVFYTGFEANDGGLGAGGTLDITGFFFNPKTESGTGTWIYTAFKNNIGDNKFNATSGTTKFGGGSAATSLVDINATNGYAQLRLRTAYTPSATADTNGNTGDVSWDDSYVYIKTSAGWKRSALSTF